jgi:hypothetical protein
MDAFLVAVHVQLHVEDAASGLIECGRLLLSSERLSLERFDLGFQALDGPIMLTDLVI